MSERFDAVVAAVRRFAHAAGRHVEGWNTSLHAWHAEHVNARAHAICPVDDWTFTPLYTDGSCPLCGWQPPGYKLRTPALSRFDWYLAALVGIAAVSAIMLVTVLNAFLG